MIESINLASLSPLKFAEYPECLHIPKITLPALHFLPSLLSSLSSSFWRNARVDKNNPSPAKRACHRHR